MSSSNFQFNHAGSVTDDVWTAVDAYAFRHSHPSTRPNAEVLENVLVASKADGLPDISASPAQAKFMALQCCLLNVTHALEVGTLGGYTAIWLASENPQLHVVTIEYDPTHVEVARKNIESAGLSDRIEVIQGAGADVLPKLKEEVLAGKREKFGFTFIDADKENNWNYLNWAADMSKPNSLLCVDKYVFIFSFSQFLITFFSCFPETCLQKYQRRSWWKDCQFRGHRPSSGGFSDCHRERRQRSEI